MIHPKKLRHSQNAFKSSALIERLITTKTDISTDDLVVDIGAGIGRISAVLSRFCAQVVAVEADEKLFEQGKLKVAHLENVKYLNLNFLEFDTDRQGEFKVFSNIPFSISAALIHKLLLRNTPLQSAYMVVQKEFAWRLIGRPVSDNSLLSISIAPWWDLKIVHTFTKKDFEPAPSVDCVFLACTRKKQNILTIDQKQNYLDFVAFVLNERKDTIKKALKDLFSFTQLKVLSGSLRLDFDKKPSNLNNDHWVGLFKAFIKYSPNKLPIIEGSFAKLYRHKKKLNK